MSAQFYATLLDEQRAADFLAVSVKTVQNWRLRKVGPRYFKISNRVRYSLDDLKAYLAVCAIEPCSPTLPAQSAR
jgi:hypothetical protein